MKIRYSLSIEDVCEYNRYHFLFSKASRKARLLRQWFVPMAPALTLGYFSYAEHNSIEFLCGVVASIILWLYYWKNKTTFIEKYVQKVYKEGRNDSLFGDHSLEISEDSIILNSKESETKLAVTRVEKIVEYKRYAFLFVSAANALIINKDKILEGNAIQVIDEIRRQLPKESYQAIEIESPSVTKS